MRVINSGFGREIICSNPKSPLHTGGLWYSFFFVQDCTEYKADFEKIMKSIIKTNRRK